MNTKEMLAERGTRYGDFTEHARLSQGLALVMRSHANWDELEGYKQEALEMIQHKVARIINGDSDYEDSWIDIIGYTQLAIDRLPNKMSEEDRRLREEHQRKIREEAVKLTPWWNDPSLPVPHVKALMDEVAEKLDAAGYLEIAKKVRKVHQPRWEE